MASNGARRTTSQRYPDELRERAVRMVFEVRERTGEKHGVITRVASELGVGAESLRNWVLRAEVDSGSRPGTSTADARRIGGMAALIAAVTGVLAGSLQDPIHAAPAAQVPAFVEELREDLQGCQVTKARLMQHVKNGPAFGFAERRRMRLVQLRCTLR